MQARLLRRLKHAEAERCLLEALVMMPPFGTLSLTGKCHAIFHVLDVDMSGDLDMNEVLALMPWLAPG
jgi:hypothetical protein